MASRRVGRFVVKAVERSAKGGREVRGVACWQGGNHGGKLGRGEGVGEGGGLRSAMEGALPPRGASALLPLKHRQSFRRTFAAAADLPPHEEIGMPSLSPTMTQGNIAKWRKKVGDSVAAGDVLCEIETDKATLEMESMEDGFLAKIILEDGAKDIPVGQPIAIMVESEEDIAKFADFSPGGTPSTPPPPKEGGSPPPPPPKQEAPAPPPPPPPPPSSPSPPPSPPGGRVFASPAAKKLAEDNKVDISKVTGTGPDGRIVKADIEDFLAKGPEPAPSSHAPPAIAGESYTDLPHTQIRKIVAQRLLQSKQTIPHYYLTVDVRVDKLNKLRAELNAAQEKAGGKKLSLNDFVIKAAAMALKKVPQCNASWTDEYIRQYHNVDISVAVQTDFGLMVPIVKDADKKGLASISEDVKRLAEKARENKLRPDEFQGGTFAISNLGMYGVKSFAAIINPPQACILAVGGTEVRVVPAKEAGEYEKALYMSVTLSCDHRVIDGALGAQWLGAFKALTEDPITLLL